MLAALSVRDIVLIETANLEFTAGDGRGGTHLRDLRPALSVPANCHVSIKIEASRCE